MSPLQNPVYSVVISLRPGDTSDQKQRRDHRHGDLSIDWVDYHSEKDVGSSVSGPGDARKELEASNFPASGSAPLSSLITPGKAYHSGRDSHSSVGDALLSRRHTQGTTELGDGSIHLFKHMAPSTLLASLESDDTTEAALGGTMATLSESNDAEGADGTLVAVLAVPAYIGIAELVEWLGAWTTCLDGLRMIRQVSENRSHTAI